MADANDARAKRGGRKQPTPKAKAAGRGAPKKRKRSAAPPKTKAAKKVARGGSTPAVAAAKRVKRNREMYVSWRRGIDATTLAERHDVTPRRVRQIIDDCRAASVEAMATTGPLTGLKITDERLVQLEESVTQAAEVTEKAIEDRNWPSALGGLKRVAEARRELLSLQQDRGLVPRNLTNLHNQWDGVELGGLLIDVLYAHGVDDSIMDEIAAMLDMRTRRDRGRVELDMRSGSYEPHVGDARPASV
jgi:hypothetical protein